MTCEEYNDWLGDAVDGTLDAGRTDMLEAHCAQCSGCRELLNDLKEIRATAAALDRRTPSPDLWTSISTKVQRLDPGVTASPSRRVHPRGRVMRRWAPLAAAAALAGLLGAAAWFGMATRQPSSPQGSSAELARSAASELHLAEQHYENAIAALERLTAERDQTLDPAVAAEITRSLQSIDRAIADSRDALKAEPDSFVAQTSLLEALRMKVALLQETVSLMNTTS